MEDFLEKEVIVSFFDTICMSSCTLCVAITFFHLMLKLRAPTHVVISPKGMSPKFHVEAFLQSSGSHTSPFHSFQGRGHQNVCSDVIH